MKILNITGHFLKCRSWSLIVPYKNWANQALETLKKDPAAKLEEDITAHIIYFFIAQ